MEQIVILLFLIVQIILINTFGLFAFLYIVCIFTNLLHSIVTSLPSLQPVLVVLGQVLLSTKQESEYELFILEIQTRLEETPLLTKSTCIVMLEFIPHILQC